MSHAAAEPAHRQLAAGRIDGYRLAVASCCERPSTGRTCCASCGTLQGNRHSKFLWG